MRRGTTFWLSVFLLILSFLPSQAQSSHEQGIRPLEMGAVITRELKGSEVHAYRLTLGAAQYAQVTLEQRGIEVAASLFGPDGKRQAKGFVSGENLVSVSTVAEMAGAYRLEVRASRENPAPGQCLVKIAELRDATPRDLIRSQAQLTFVAGEDLQSQGTAPALKQALEKFDASLLLWRAGDDRRGEGAALSSLAVVY